MERTKRLQFGLVAGFICATVAANALFGQDVSLQGELDQSKLYLRAEFVDTRTAKSLIEDRPTAFDPDEHYVIQLDGPIDPKRRKMLKSLGAKLDKYLPVNAFLARLGACEPDELLDVEFVQWVGVYRDDWKVSPDLLFVGPVPVRYSDPAGDQQGSSSSSELQAVIVLFPGQDVEEVATLLEDETGLTVTSKSVVGDQGLIGASVPWEKVERLSERTEIQYVEKAPRASLRNDTTHWIVQSDVVDFDPIWDQGLHGEGMVGQIIDSILDEEHCAFFDDVTIGPEHRKIVAFHGDIEASPASHGTHTCGTMVGKQVDGDSRDGMAYEAKLVFTDWAAVSIGSSTSLNAALLAAYEDGARVHSNSWGADYRIDYNSWSMQIDQFSYEHEESMVAFAVTNAGVLYTPENAKNVLAVGASHDTPDQHLHRSGGTGPTSDGRRKPEVYAPGASTISSKPGTCDYGTMSGTSMACPAVSGIALLVRQYFVEGWYPTGTPVVEDSLTPTGALMRAVLINSAVDMTGIEGYPSDREGWGRVLVDNSLFFDGDSRELIVQDLRNVDGLTTGRTDLVNVSVGDEEQLRVTLVWSDVPATVGTAFAPVNNLDLEVAAPSGETYKGNVFAEGSSVPGGDSDDRNNVEQVHINSPEPGVYTVTVHATAVNERTQGYALVITGDVLPGPEFRLGDSDTDGDVDLDDLYGFDSCLSGPDQAPGFVTPTGKCLGTFDADEDGDVDLNDFTAFQETFATTE